MRGGRVLAPVRRRWRGRLPGSPSLGGPLRRRSVGRPSHPALRGRCTRSGWVAGGLPRRRPPGGESRSRRFAESAIGRNDVGKVGHAPASIGAGAAVVKSSVAESRSVAAGAVVLSGRAGWSKSAVGETDRDPGLRGLTKSTRYCSESQLLVSGLGVW